VKTARPGFTLMDFYSNNRDRPRAVDLIAEIGIWACCRRSILVSNGMRRNRALLCFIA